MNKSQRDNNRWVHLREVNDDDRRLGPLVEVIHPHSLQGSPSHEIVPNGWILVGPDKRVHDEDPRLLGYFVRKAGGSLEELKYLLERSEYAVQIER